MMGTKAMQYDRLYIYCADALCHSELPAGRSPVSSACAIHLEQCLLPATQRGGVSMDQHTRTEESWAHAKLGPGAQPRSRSVWMSKRLAALGTGIASADTNAMKIIRAMIVPLIVEQECIES